MFTMLVRGAVFARTIRRKGRHGAPEHRAAVEQPRRAPDHAAGDKEQRIRGTPQGLARSRR